MSRRSRTTASIILVDMNLSPDWVPMLIKPNTSLGGNVAQVVNDGANERDSLP
jgi:hypothetical protein